MPNKCLPLLVGFPSLLFTPTFRICAVITTHESAEDQRGCPGHTAREALAGPVDWCVVPWGPAWCTVRDSEVAPERRKGAGLAEEGLPEEVAGLGWWSSASQAAGSPGASSVSWVTPTASWVSSP